MKIITGATGVTHVTSNNEGEFNQALLGDGLVVLPNGNRLAAAITSNNLITISDGDLVFQGRHALIEPGLTDEITIATGTVDINRNDLIVARYVIDTNTGYENITLEVLEGTETSGTATDPTYTSGVIRTGATIAECPLYRVRLEGVNIAGVDRLFTVNETSLLDTVKSLTTNLAALRAEVEANGLPEVFSFRINKNYSGCNDMVEYTRDTRGLQPAYMDYVGDRFNYGSFAKAFFIKGIKPCILKQDGTVKCYLNPDDYEHDVDGNPVVIDSTLANANVMIEFPKIYYKIVPDDNGAEVFIAATKIDSDYVDYAYIAQDGTHKEHFYYPAYQGYVLNSVLRSVSGVRATSSTTGANEITYATANGTGWHTVNRGQRMVIDLLLILLGRGLNTQVRFGNGNYTGGQSASNFVVNGSLNGKGLFYGTNGSGAAVKVFGIENYWANRWERIAGDINDNGVRRIKLCWGQEDGSTTDEYNITGAGYVNVGATPSGTSGGYISEMLFTSSGMYSKTASGSATTYYADGMWFNNGQVDYALAGGACYNSALCGAFAVYLDFLVSDSYWNFGASPSFV